MLNVISNAISQVFSCDQKNNCHLACTNLVHYADSQWRLILQAAPQAPLSGLSYWFVDELLGSLIASTKLIDKSETPKLLITEPIYRAYDF